MFSSLLIMYPSRSAASPHVFKVGDVGSQPHVAWSVGASGGKSRVFKKLVYKNQWEYCSLAMKTPKLLSAFAIFLLSFLLNVCVVHSQTAGKIIVTNIEAGGNGAAYG